MNWKVGDWCFCEFTLHQITDMKDDRITSVSDGYFSRGSWDIKDRCYPLDITIKLISNNFEYYSDLLHKIDNLEFKKGFPDIHRELVRRWCECCDDYKDTKKIEKHYAKLEEWYHLTVGGIKQLRKEKLKKLENH